MGGDDDYYHRYRRHNDGWQPRQGGGAEGDGEGEGEGEDGEGGMLRCNVCGSGADFLVQLELVQRKAGGGQAAPATAAAAEAATTATATTTTTVASCARARCPSTCAGATSTFTKRCRETWN